MNLVSLLGLLGTIIGLVRAVPQLVRLLKAQEASGVSVDTSGTSSIVSFGWAVYGIWTDQPYVSLATGSSGIIFALVSILALRLGRNIREFRVTPIWFAVLLFSGLLFAHNGLGVVLSVSALVSNIPQVRIALREENLLGLSLGTWLLSMSDGLVWGIYSLLTRDTSIMAYGVFQLTTSGLVVALKLARGAIRRFLQLE